jgi:hypothetical protein
MPQRIIELEKEKVVAILVVVSSCGPPWMEDTIPQDWSWGLLFVVPLFLGDSFQTPLEAYIWLGFASGWHSEMLEDKRRISLSPALDGTLGNSSNMDNCRILCN